MEGREENWTRPLHSSPIRSSTIIKSGTPKIHNCFSAFPLRLYHFPLHYDRCTFSSPILPSFLLLLDLKQKSAIDVRQHTTKGNSRANQSVQLFVTPNGELQMTGGDTLDFEIFSGVTGKLENFGGKVFEDGGDVDGS